MIQPSAKSNGAFGLKADTWPLQSDHEPKSVRVHCRLRIARTEPTMLPSRERV